MRRTYRNAAFFPLLVLMLQVTACHSPDATTPTSLKEGTAALASTGTGATLSIAPLTIDDDMSQIAIDAPGFAGFFVEKGTVITLVNTRADRHSVTAALRRWQASRSVSLPTAMAWREARFDYSVLYSTRQAIRKLRFRGLRYIDVDEQANRVVVAVASAADSVSAWAALVQAVDSSAAVAVVVSPAIQRASSLSDLVRPLTPGTMITMLDATVGSCTAGPIARSTSNGYRWMIINSHCTNSSWEYDGSVVHQPFVWNPWGTRVGVESIDPGPTFEGAICDDETWCRGSDAAAVRLDSSNTPFKIARTTWVSIVPGDSGSTTLVTDGYFSVAGTVALSSLVVGQGLHKVGKTTGWTAGSVTRTCVDVTVGWDPEFVLRCQYYASGTVEGGDSGSPVFQWYGGAPSYDVNLAGILWGRASRSEFIFSAWAYIAYDLGSFIPYP